ncbi:MAG: SdpI family protein [Candidatus Aenigmatarchaeota archaeon]
MRKIELAALIIVIFSFFLAFYLYPQMQETMAFHWNIEGKVDSYASKSLALFLMPAIGFLLFLLFLAIPRIDPLKKNIEKFRNYFDSFFILILLFLLYLYSLTIIWNLGFNFNMVKNLVPAFSVLFFYTGVLVENAKRNWFVGIRTPWTLSSEKVWNKTHKLGGKLIKIAAFISLLGFFFENLAFYFLILPILFACFYSVVYSYFEFKKIEKR